MQQIVATVKEAYLADIHNHTTDSINNTMADIITHLQEKYGQLMPHEFFERKGIVKKMTYILDTQSQPYFLLSNNFSSSLTSP